MGILVGVAATALGVALILLLTGMLLPQGGEYRPGSARKKKGRLGPAPALPPRTCPLCATVLEPGERVKSDILRGKSDSLMRIYGCPHCWPPVEGSALRHCPVCGQGIAPDGHALARYFERPGRKHVHVLGCSGCRTMSPRRT